MYPCDWFCAPASHMCRVEYQNKVLPSIKYELIFSVQSEMLDLKLANHSRGAFTSVPAKENAL